MSERRSLFDNLSEQEGSFFEASSSSLMSFSPPSSHQPGGQYSYTGINQFSFNPTVYTPQYASQTSSIASTKSTGSKHKSYTPCDEWVWGLSPRFPASLEPGLPLSSASSLNDPILRSFASHTPSGSSASPANSAIGQTVGLNAPSSSSSTGTTESGEIDSDEEEPNPGEGDEELRTPATSDTSGEADIIFVLDHVYGDQVAAIPSRESLIGLQLPREFLLSRDFVAFADEDTNFFLRIIRASETTVILRHER
jgi:hypothetical protein